MSLANYSLTKPIVCKAIQTGPLFSPSLLLAFLFELLELTESDLHRRPCMIISRSRLGDLGHYESILSLQLHRTGLLHDKCILALQLGQRILMLFPLTLCSASRLVLSITFNEARQAVTQRSRGFPLLTCSKQVKQHCFSCRIS